jgi:adhesin/invasin
LNITKKAISVGMSAALLASLVATVAAPAAFAATITNITYGPSGSTVATSPAGGSLLASFSPATPVTPGSTITLGLPTGTTTTGLVAADLTIEQIGGTATAPTALTGAGSTTIVLTVAGASLSGNGTGPISVLFASGYTQAHFVNPTVATTTATFSVTTQVGDTGSINSVTFVAGAASAGTVNASPTSVPANGTSTSTVTATVTDSYGNPVSGVTVSFAKTNSAVLSASSAVTGSNGTASVTVTDTVVESSTVTPTASGVTFSSASRSVTFTSVPETTTCSPSSGTLNPGQTVNCSWSAGNTSQTFTSWTASGFTPTLSVSTSQTFTAGAALGTATIVRHSSSGTQTFTYTIASVAPPATPGTITISKTVSVPRGGTTATALGTYTFTEGSAGDWAVNQWVQVCLAPASGPTSSLTLAGGTVTGPDALTSPTLSVSGNCFTVTIGGSDNTRIEAFSVSGLTLTASSAAGPGTISATYTTNMGNNAVYFGGSTQTATGSLAASYAAGTQCVTINVTANSPAFTSGGTLVVGGVNPESVTLGATCGTPGTGQQAFMVTFADPHTVNDAVTESVTGNIGSAPSPGAVVDALALTSAGTPQLMIGVTNQTPATVALAEQPYSTGLLAAGTVITLKITTPGVLFSNAPTAAIGGTSTGFSLDSNTATLSLDRTSATFTVDTADTTGLTTLTFSMQYDVAATVTSGGLVNLQVTAGSIAVVPASVANATLGAAIFVTSNAPTIYINQNDQPIGNVTITEKSAGALSSAAGTNTFFVCLTTGEYFIRPPWAVVTSGNLLISTNSSLTAGASSAAGTQITGPFPYGADNCYAWAVYSASTVASTITIEGVSATGTPTPTAHVNVPGWLAPGPTYLAIGTMASNSSTTGNLVDLATVAVRAFQSGITVTAGTPVPFIAPGTTSGAASTLTIAETGNDLLRAGEFFTCTILPNATTESQQTYLQTAISNGLPIVSTNGATTGLQAHLVGTSSTSFTVEVDQAAVAGLGSITMSNINYTTVSDAVTGPVIVECKSGAETPGQPFDAFVSNALIGTGLQRVVISASGSGGTAYSMSSQVLAKGQKLTVTFRTNPQLAGDRLGIWLEVRAKGATTFGALKPHTSIVLDVNGVGTYTYSASSGVKIGLVGKFVGNATQAPASSYPTIFGLFQ